MKDLDAVWKFVKDHSIDGHAVKGRDSIVLSDGAAVFIIRTLKDAREALGY